MNIVEENNEKKFTKEIEKDIMKLKHNLLNKNKDFYRREGLYVKENKDIKFNEILDEFNIIERLFLKKKIIKVYNKMRIKIINTMLK